MAAPVLWEASDNRKTSSNTWAFMKEAERRHGVALPDYDAFHRWSIDEPEAFWDTCWDLFDLRASTKGARVAENIERMPGARFFPDATINWAENLLRRQDDSPAIIFRGEDKARGEMSWRELYDAVSRLAQALRADGLQPGDRVAAYMPNIPETVVAMLAVTSIGGVFTSASPDFGIQGVLDRFGQVEPKILISADGYYYNGKTHSSLDRLPAIVDGMPTVERVVVVGYTEAAPDVSGIPKAVTLTGYMEGHAPGEIDFTPRGFNDPLYVVYSSGTTGVPKCIVHGIGGVLLKHLTEHRLMSNISAGDRVFWFTTTGWMMWNWLVTALASEATIVLYDGSPFYPDGNVLYDLADEAEITMFGTSAKFIDACNKAGIEPAKTHSLTAMQTLGSTGSPLVPEGFDYVYSKVKADVHLASVSGGTDLLGCFVGGCILKPVRRGEIQCKAPGMATEIYNEDGEPVVGEKGELVCDRSFPSMPIGFWNDPDGQRYFDAYYAKYPNVWCHGDWCEFTEGGGFVIYGRSDATLNSGGVRIGTAEIYRQVEKLDQVVESLVIGQEWDNDTRIVLFVVLREGLELDDALEAAIRKQIRDNTTPRHVPARIVQVTDIPRTKSNKIVELAVREVVHGRPVKNKEALMNPEALDQFAGRAELSV